MEDFLAPSELPYELPDFAHIQVDSLVPAFRTALADHCAEITAIAENPAEPTWENTMEALEAAGQMLNRVLVIVYNYAGTMASPDVLDVESTVSGELAQHMSSIVLNEKLWSRVRAVPQQPEGSEEAALQEYWLRRFVRGGANLSAEQRETLRSIDARLAALTTSFGAQLQRSTEQHAVYIENEKELQGLDESTRTQLAAAAREAGKASGWLIRLGLPSVQPILENLADARTRAKVYEASLHRAGHDNDETLLEIVRLRAQRAELLGYGSHADYVAEVETAGSVKAVEELLHSLTPAAVANAYDEYKQAQDKRNVVEDGEEQHPMTAADWPYWSAKLRAEQLNVDEAELKRYFPLEQVMVDGAFYAAERLYGLRVTERTDLVGYHPDVRVWEICEGDDSAHPGAEIGLLLTDMYARPTKRGGAWMSSFVDQSNLIGQLPVVVNVMNIAKPADGEQALLTMDEVTTVFHEFGHALHGLLSDVRYPSLSGTSVPRDFVEFPSQINENWAVEPEILGHYARHIDTGQPLSAELIGAVRQQAKWAQGFATTEYLSACIVDLAWHKLSAEEAEKVTDIDAFEKRAVEDAGLYVEGLVAPRYRSAYFNHIFSGGYSAGYWSYLWAEVLDADGFQAFIDTGAARGEEHEGGDIDAEDVRFAGDRFRRMILSRGATIDYEDAFWMFRGQQHSVEPLLRRRGLSGAISEP
ncbi:M3 family peptidase [Corynebacterium sp. 4HC-13]|uniref:M3 family metallopeptidase n=1 Tax=Corynebacterium anserum TaxID=2684406 RepID=UPI001639F671|nr:M3 family metallopeptidase [Corynebacterium anserum]MBC2681135.1 M3 family peptidase [Corynebacterium anserum]